MIDFMLHALITLVLGLFLLVVIILWGIAMWVVFDESRSLYIDLKKENADDEDR